MLKFIYPAVFSKNSDKGYTVKFPDLAGCITYGDDPADAILMAQDAACGWVLDELESGAILPKASEPENIKLKKNEYISMTVLDIDSYAKLYGTQAVRKNTTIPAWLNTFGAKIQANYSELLAESLFKKYQAYMEQMK